jgi:hypothetical protein
VLLALIRAETLARSNACTKRQLDEAEVRAQTSMHGCRPARTYNRNGYFEVTGSHSGTLYRIRRDRPMNIDELDGCGARVTVWCFEPEGRLAIGDVMLAQKIALETDEQAALAIANRYRGTGYTG